MQTLGRHIVHMDLDSFFVSVERLRNSSLLGKPVIIGGTSDRGVVASCSYEARKFGVSSAMPSKMARYLCPDAIFIKGDMELYSKYSADVTQVIAEKAPLFEKASIDEHYLDLTGMDRFFGTLSWTHELRQSITKETGLPISFGLSVNKTVSKIATNEIKPNGEMEVPGDRIKSFLSPLSIKKIPMLGDKSYQKLRSMGIATIDTLSQVPINMMEKVLGKNGVSLWEKANGIDTAPIVPYVERKSISTERTFDADTTDIVKLNELLITMVEEIAFQLRKEQRLTSCVTIKIRYSDFNTETKQERVEYTASDHLLIQKTKELFTKLYNKRMLIRMVGVKLSNLAHGHQQINLFEDTPQLVNLYQAMDKMRLRFGDKAVIRAVGL